MTDSFTKSGLSEGSSFKIFTEKPDFEKETLRLPHKEILTVKKLSVIALYSE